MACLSFFGCDRKAGIGPIAPAELYPPQTAPELIAPYDGMPGNRLAVVFRWEESTDATCYHVQIAKDSTFSQLVYDEPGISGDMMGHSGLEPFTTYFWRVRAVNQDGEGPWSPVWTFATGDGSSPGTIAGTWALIGGEFFWSDDLTDPEDPEVYREVLNVSGDVLLSLREGNDNIEGERRNELIKWNYESSICFDSTWTVPIHENGTYSTLDDSALIIELNSLQYHWFSTSDTVGYSMREDTLNLRFYYIYNVPYPYPLVQYSFLRM